MGRVNEGGCQARLRVKWLHMPVRIMVGMCIAIDLKYFSVSAPVSLTIAAKAEYFGLFNSSFGVSNSNAVPLSKTKTRSESIMVSNLWAIVNVEQ